MIVIYRNDNSELNHLFRKEIEFNVPYLETQIGLVSMNLWRKLSPEVQFYFPAVWGAALSGIEGAYFYKNLEDITVTPDDIVVYTGVFLLPESLDFPAVLQNPEETFALGNMLYVGTGTKGVMNLLVRNRAPDQEFMSFEYVELSTYLETVLDLLPESSISTENGSTFTGGAAYINSENVIGSKIYGPCYISESSTVIDSIIYPGTIILDSHIERSELRGSFAYQSHIEDCTLFETLAADSSVSHIQASGSRLAAGTALAGRKK